MRQKKAAPSKYPPRFWLNLSLLTIATTAAWVWFKIHLEPHVNARIFGTLTGAAIVLYALGTIKSFIGDDAKNALRAALANRPMTLALFVAIPVIILAFLTTKSVYFVQSKTFGDEGRPKIFRVTRPNGRTDIVELNKDHAEVALTFVALRRFTLLVDTIVPRGFRQAPVMVAAPYEEVLLPDAKYRKPRRLLRLVPGQNLLHLTAKPDRDYHLMVYRNGQLFFDQPFVQFESLYLGAPLADVKDDIAALNADANFVGDLQEYLRKLGATDENDLLKRNVDRYVRNYRAADTAELKDNDQVRIVLTSTTGPTAFDESFAVSPPEVRTVFLKGVPKK